MQYRIMRKERAQYGGKKIAKNIETKSVNRDGSSAYGDFGSRAFCYSRGTGDSFRTGYFGGDCASGDRGRSTTGRKHRRRYIDRNYIGRTEGGHR